MKKIISLLLIGAMLFTQIQFTSAENVSLSVSQKKLYDKVFPRIKTLIDKKDDAYRLKLISALQKLQQTTKNTDQQIVLQELINKISVPTPTVNEVINNTDSTILSSAVTDFINGFEQVAFIKFASEELDANKQIYTDEVALSSSLGFRHNEKTFTFPTLTSNKDLWNQLSKSMDDYSEAMKKKSKLRCYIQPVPLSSINDSSLIIGSTKSNYAINVRNSLRHVDLRGSWADSLTNGYMRGNMGYQIEQKKKQELALLMTTMVISGLDKDGNKEIKAFPVGIGASSEIQLVPTSFPSLDIYAKNSTFATTNKSRKLTTLSSTQLVLDGASPFRFVSLVKETTGELNNLSVLSCDYASNKVFTPSVTGEKQEELTDEQVIANMEMNCRQQHDKYSPTWMNNGGGSYYNTAEFIPYGENTARLNYAYPPSTKLISGLLIPSIYQLGGKKLKSMNASDYCETVNNPCSGYIGGNKLMSYGPGYIGKYEVSSDLPNVCSIEVSKDGVVKEKYNERVR